jgi:thiol-disulfide isomerase/thioredoxin
MRLRWIAATVSALALALLTLDSSELWSSPASGTACPADSKPANLNFTLKDVQGRNIRLADYKGKVILLDFWATWCGPCKVEIPWFVEFQQKYGAQGLQVIGVSVDDTVEKLRPYVKEYKMNYPVLQGLHHDDIQDAYGPLWGIPVTTIISRDARICAKHSGISSKEKFENAIKALL